MESSFASGLFFNMSQQGYEKKKKYKWICWKGYNIEEKTSCPADGKGGK